MKKQLFFHEKPIDITLAAAAVQAHKKLNSPLLIEIQIYFSCLLGKRLAFYTERPMNGTCQLEADQFASILADAQPFTENIFIRFNTVMTKDCPVSDYSGPPPVTDFKISNLKPYVPSWLNINFSNGQWSGEYGWPASKTGQANTRQIRGKTI